MKIERYFYNYDFEKLKEEGYEPTGRAGLMISGAPIDNMFFFVRELEQAIEDVNPNLNGVTVASVFYKSDKNGLENCLEKVTLTTGGKAEESQHFYIIQALKKINKKKEDTQK